MAAASDNDVSATAADLSELKDSEATIIDQRT